MNYRNSIGTRFCDEATDGTEGGASAGTPAAAPKAEKKAKPAKKAAKPAKKAKAKAKAKKGGTGAAGVTGPAVLKRYAPEYHKDKEKKTAGGNVSVDTDDDLAKKLRGKSIDEVYAMAVKVGIEDKDGGKETIASLKKRYGKLNLGMQRMNLGNRMRSLLNAK